MSFIRMIRFSILRRFSSTAVKPFDQMPGPKRVPLLGTLWKYFPYIGDYDFNKLTDVGFMKLKQYGSVVREEFGSGIFIVNVFEPEDIEMVYKNEGKFPSRRSHLALQHYREARPHLYNTGGLLPVNGSEWWRIRSNFQKSLSKIKAVRALIPKNEEIFDEFFDKFVKPGVPNNNFLSEISRLNIELTWMLLFGERLGAFEDKNLHPDSIPSRLMSKAELVNHIIIATDSTETFWKIVKTKPYKQMEEAFDFIEKTIYPQLKKTHDRVMNKKCDVNEEKCLIEQYFENPAIDFKDVFGMVVDLILGGVDTTSYTSSFIVYHLANNERAQRRLNEEASRLCNNSPITSEILNEANYARAVLKESLRLNPIAIGISRILDNDTILGGFLVPRETVVFTQNWVACRQEKHFKNANSFIPERWVKGSEEYTFVSPFLILPFSHGTRTCIARRLAEQNLLTFILKIGNKYNLKWLGAKLGVVTPLICKPDSPVQVLFTTKNGQS
ncbi:cytochrome P450 302a1, mitochondrial [Cimex lectularius]|uniref:Cytochrome P450 n=1 Tax=Cimex lectularius TaxID=79782 RepID=A0A8I6S5Q6_CIMLE|nr:cytochrome P450 302a1, mitochondrial [Cimex lectularius]